MKCSVCNSDLIEGATICSNCGNLVNNTEVNNVDNNIAEVSKVETDIVENNVENTIVETNVEEVTNIENDIVENNTSDIVLNTSINDNNFDDKHKKGNKKVLVILTIVLLLIAALIVYFVFLGNNNDLEEDDKRVEKIGEVSLIYDYITETDKNEFIIYDAEPNIAFEVTEDTEFKLTSENGDKVKAKIIDNKIVNLDGYEKGKKYYLSITDGEFVSSELKEIKDISFKIKRDEVKKFKFKEDTVKVDSKNVSLNAGKVDIIDGDYKVGDVLLIYDGANVKDAIVIKTVNGSGNYSYEKATLDQIYSELDFYYEEVADLSNYETAESIKNYVIQTARNSEWYNVIVQTTDEEPKIEVKLTDVENGIKAEVKVKIAAGDGSAFLKSDFHDLEFSYTHTLQVVTLLDITLNNWDVSLKIKNEQEFKFNISNTIIDYDEPVSEKLIKKIQEAIDKKTNVDKDRKEFDFVVVPVPTPVPGLTIQLELSLNNEVSLAVEFESSLVLSNSITVGFDFGMGEDFKPLGNATFDVEDVTVSVSGNLELKSGIQIEGQVDFVGAFEAGLGLTGGLYGEGNASIATNYKKRETVLTYGGALGFFFDIAIELKAGAFTYEHEFVEEKFPFWEKEVEKKLQEKHVVKFDTDGGNELKAQEIVYSEKVTKPTDPVKEGYEFVRWELNGEEYNFDTEVTEDFELKAVWSEIVVEELKDLSDVEAIMNKLDNYTYEVTMVMKTGIMDMTTTTTCIEDRKNMISYCTSTIYGVVTEEYVDYKNNMIYSRSTNPYDTSSSNGEWTKMKYTGAETNSYVGLGNFVKNVKKTTKMNGTYYTGTIEMEKLMSAVDSTTGDDNSSLFSGDIDITMFVNNSNYLEETKFTMTVAGIEEDATVKYSNFNTSKSLEIPKEAK